MKYEITQVLAQAILDYLSEKPFKEAHLLIAEIQKMKPILQSTSPLESTEEDRSGAA